MQTKGFVVTEYAKIKEQFPEFQATLAKLESDLTTKASAAWSPLRYGGTQPMAGQYGKSTIMPASFYGFAGTTLASWNQNLTSTGNQILLTGSNAGALYEDYMVGVAGIVFLDDLLRVTEIKLIISDRKIARINLEEAMTFNQPTIIFEQGFMVDEEVGFELDGYVETPGYQRIKPLGLQMNRVPNKLQISNTGVALT